MKLYSTVCFGLLVVFFCDAEKPVTISDFCQNASQEITKLRKLSEAEARTLSRSRLDAINSLKRKQKALCAGPERADNK